MVSLFLDTDTTIKEKLGSILEKLNKRHIRREQLRRFDMTEDDFLNNICPSTQFLVTHNTKLYDPRILWNVIAMLHLCLVSKVQNRISYFSIPGGYSHLVTNKTLNLLL